MAETNPGGPTLIESHRPVDFTVQEFDGPIVGFVVNRADDGRQYHVAGKCPRCQGRTTATWPVGTGIGHKGLFSPARPRRDADDGLRTVFCDCGHAHANRPDSAVFQGCGAHWRVALP